MNKLRSFTLVEMIIVIVLIGIMLSITLNISGNQTKELRFRIARENFLANYNAFIIRAITTNSSDLQLVFTKDGTEPLIVSGASSIYFEDTPTIKIKSINEAENPDDAILSFDPQEGRCSMIWSSAPPEQVKIVLQYVPKPDIEKCYELNLSTCKLRQCP